LSALDFFSFFGKICGFPRSIGLDCPDSFNYKLRNFLPREYFEDVLKDSFNDKSEVYLSGQQTEYLSDDQKED
jgi:hypothetical protein